jgi:hypothetical protein
LHLREVGRTRGSQRTQREVEKEVRGGRGMSADKERIIVRRRAVYLSSRFDIVEEGRGVSDGTGAYKDRSSDRKSVMRR